MQVNERFLGIVLALCHNPQTAHKADVLKTDKIIRQDSNNPIAKIEIAQILKIG
jgi:hypothetical protein